MSIYSCNLFYIKNKPPNKETLNNIITFRLKGMPQPSGDGHRPCKRLFRNRFVILQGLRHQLFQLCDPVPFTRVRAQKLRWFLAIAGFFHTLPKSDTLLRIVSRHCSEFKAPIIGFQLVFAGEGYHYPDLRTCSKCSHKEVLCSGWFL